MANFSDNQRKRKATQLNNDYTNNMLGKQKNMRGQKARQRRRMLIKIILYAAVLAVVVKTIFYQDNILEAKEAEKTKVQKELVEVQKQTNLLERQIDQLEDDEYIEKLLRKEYLLSNDGEIIFVIPDEVEEPENSKVNEK